MTRELHLSGIVVIHLNERHEAVIVVRIPPIHLGGKLCS